MSSGRSWPAILALLCMVAAAAAADEAEGEGEGELTVEQLREENNELRAYLRELEYQLESANAVIEQAKGYIGHIEGRYPPLEYPIVEGQGIECLSERCTDALYACVDDEENCYPLISAYTDTCVNELESLCPNGICPDAAGPLWDCYHENCLEHWKDDKIPVRNFKGILTEEERNAIRELQKEVYKVHGGKHRTFGENFKKSVVNGHEVTFLNNEFLDSQPELFRRLEGLARQADFETGWGLQRFGMYVRVVEFLDYQVGESKVIKDLEVEEKSFLDNGTLGLGWHVDDDSLITLVAMLSDPKEYDGGLLQTEFNCNISSHPMLLGDVHVYRSLQKHRVLPVTSGTRQVLVVEWWPHNIHSERDRMNPPDNPDKEGYGGSDSSDTADGGPDHRDEL